MYNVAIIFELNQNWIGGSYYIRNLVSALGMLPENARPRVTILCDRPESFSFIRETGYPALAWIKMSQFLERPEAFPFDAIFPYPIAEQAYRTVSWIPDFQELHLPYYFSSEEIAQRRKHHLQRFKTAGLVVSSQDVRSDVERFYPGECANIAVVNFATFDHFDKENLAQVRERYGLVGRYIMCPNQMWVHKNHVVVLRAIASLKGIGVEPVVCFTGSESDYRVTGYADTLRALATQWGLDENVRFLGFIPRADQLTLMWGADYIVQPSLFEGWSTVIEDAKAMGQFVVASDLPVHIEQLPENARFFNRSNPWQLAEIMKEFDRAPPSKTAPEAYEEARRRFGLDFLEACNRLVPKLETPQERISQTEFLELSNDNLRQLETTKPVSEPRTARWPRRWLKQGAPRRGAFDALNEKLSTLSKVPPANNIQDTHVLRRGIWLSTEKGTTSRLCFEPLRHGFRLRLRGGYGASWVSFSLDLPRRTVAASPLMSLKMTGTSGTPFRYRPCLRYIKKGHPFTDVFADEFVDVDFGTHAKVSILDVDQALLSQSDIAQLHLFIDGDEVDWVVTGIEVGRLRQ